MYDINVTKISSKGQIVLPFDMRKDFKEGEKLVVIKNKNQIILKKVKDFSKNIEEDLEFARKTEKAWKEYDKGKFISYSKEEFLKRLKKW